MDEAIADCLKDGRSITFIHTTDAAVSRLSYSVRVLFDAISKAANVTTLASWLGQQGKQNDI